MSSPSICHSNPREIRVGGSTTKSLETVLSKAASVPGRRERNRTKETIRCNANLHMLEISLISFDRKRANRQLHRQPCNCPFAYFLRGTRLRFTGFRLDQGAGMTAPAGSHTVPVMVPRSLGRGGRRYSRQDTQAYHDWTSKTLQRDYHVGSLSSEDFGNFPLECELRKPIGIDFSCLRCNI